MCVKIPAPPRNSVDCNFPSARELNSGVPSPFGFLPWPLLHFPPDTALKSTFTYRYKTKEKKKGTEKEHDNDM